MALSHNDKYVAKKKEKKTKEENTLINFFLILEKSFIWNNRAVCIPITLF